MIAWKAKNKWSTHLRRTTALSRTASMVRSYAEQKMWIFESRKIIILIESNNIKLQI